MMHSAPQTQILVTGASGWVGFMLVNDLLKRSPGARIHALVPPKPIHSVEAERFNRLKSLGRVEIHEIDLLTLVPDQLDVKFSAIYHLAAHTATETPGQHMRVNDEGSRRLVAALGPRLKNTPFVYTGSIASVDAFSPDPRGVSEAIIPAPRTQYGKSKLEGERILSAASRSMEFPLHIVRAANITGPGGFRPGGLFDVILKSLTRRGLFVRMPWPGQISIIDVRDFVNALQRIAEQNAPVGGRILHAAHSSPVSIDDMIDAAGIPRPRKLPIRPLMSRSFFTWWLDHAPLPAKLHTTVWRICHLLNTSMVMDTTAFAAALPNLQLIAPETSLKDTFADAKV